MKETNHQEELSDILGIQTSPLGSHEITSWAKIYVAIGELQTRANKPCIGHNQPYTFGNTLPLTPRENTAVPLPTS